jgi:hypothetical protein
MLTPDRLAASNTEHAHQTALFCWCASNYDRYPQLKYMFAIPNGEARTGFAGARLKAAGVRPGVPDIFLPVASVKAGINIPGLFIEMKRPEGQLSKEQSQYFWFLKQQGYRCEECHGWEAAVVVIEDYLSNA